ncbi:MAG: EboA domain-containing protein [Myxococcales bacterium]|nr:EboA domain-containing protein [Myxococcales bacterium]MCB9525895.1 EboA domain-containing protein [Myxococcales bacterium]
MPTPLALLTGWLDRQLDGPAAEWLRGRLAHLAGAHGDRDLYVAVGLVPRKLGKADLALTGDDLGAAHAARKGWDPTGWSVDQAARLALLLTASHRGEAFFEAFHQLWRTADVGEQISFYRGLPLLPEPARHLWRATDGCRTNIKAVFESIAHRNPYPAEHFDEVAWNQMCLKALFVGAPLHPIQGLDARHNGPLARMMTDYAFERWAASRPVSWELWRCVGPHPDDRCLIALERAIQQHEDSLTAGAAALACATSHAPAATALLAHASNDTRKAIEAGTLTWAALCARAGA